MIKTVSLPNLGNANMRYWPQSSPSHIRFYVPNPFETAPLVGHIFFRERRDLVQIDRDRVENAVDAAREQYSTLGRMLWGSLWDKLEDANINRSGRIILPEHCGYLVGNYKQSDGNRLPRVIVFGVGKVDGKTVFTTYFIDVESHLDIKTIKGMINEWVADKEPANWSDVKEEVLIQAILDRIRLLLANEAVVENRDWVFTGREASKITMLTNELVMDSSGLVVYEKLENIQDWLLENGCSITYSTAGNKKTGWIITPKGKISFGYRG